jgi:hypothetical protein
MLRIETKATNVTELAGAAGALRAVLEQISADGLAPMVSQKVEDPLGIERTVYMLEVSY